MKTGIFPRRFDEAEKRIAVIASPRSLTRQKNPTLCQPIHERALAHFTFVLTSACEAFSSLLGPVRKTRARVARGQYRLKIFFRLIERLTAREQLDHNLLRFCQR